MFYVLENLSSNLESEWGVALSFGSFASMLILKDELLQVEISLWEQSGAWTTQDLKCLKYVNDGS